MRDSVQTLLASKVQVCMITGDGKETAQEIARSLGILSRDDIVEEEEKKSFLNKVMLSGSELDAMSDSHLAELAESVGVYYRVSPLHKLRIVKALQRTGHVVGMTGEYFILAFRVCQQLFKQQFYEQNESLFMIKNICEYLPLD